MPWVKTRPGSSILQTRESKIFIFPKGLCRLALQDCEMSGGASAVACEIDERSPAQWLSLVISMFSFLKTVWKVRSLQASPAPSTFRKCCCSGPGSDKQTPEQHRHLRSAHCVMQPLSMLHKSNLQTPKPLSPRRNDP